jgi:serine/threonine-protein kinase
MLVGEPPFTGPTAQAIVSRVMTAPAPTPSASRTKVPAGVDAAILTALEKLPADRFATAAEFAAALAADRAAAPTTGRVRQSSNTFPRGRGVLLLAGGVAMLAAVFAAGLRLGRSDAPGLPPARLALVAPRLGVVTTSTPGRQLAITPAGDAIVYVGASDSGNALFLQRLDADDPVQIAGSANLRDPAVTPDGRYVLALSPDGGRKLPIAGGTPRPVPLPSTTFVGSFAPDGAYWFTTVDISGLARLTPTDSLIPLAVSLERQRGLRMQQVLDDGHTALVVRASSVTPSGPGLLFDLRTGDVTPLLDGPVIELRVIQGELIVGLPDGSLTAAPFDERRHRILGPPVRVATSVAINSNFLLDFAVTRSGTLVYSREGPPSLVLVDRSGAASVALAEQPQVHSPRFAPDGRRIAFDLTTPDGRDVWIYELDRHAYSRATFVGSGHDAIWSPDGRSLTFTQLLGSLAGVYRTRPGSTAPPESLFAGPHLDYTGTWLPDGSALVTDASNLAGHSGGDVALIANAGRGPLEPLLASPFLERFAVPSPDGRRLAFTSDQTGTEEVYLQPLSRDGEQVQVSQGGGAEPVWAPDGRVLYYRGVHDRQAVLKAATLGTAPGIVVASDRVLFPVPEYVGTGPHANYDVSPDGRTFAMIRRNPKRHIVVIQDLPELLRRLRGTARTTP